MLPRHTNNTRTNPITYLTYSALPLIVLEMSKLVKQALLKPHLIHTFFYTQNWLLTFIQNFRNILYIRSSILFLGSFVTCKCKHMKSRSDRSKEVKRCNNEAQ